MTKRLALAALALLLIATAATAADLPQGKWWRRAEVIQRLGLSDEQQNRLDVIFRNAAPDLIDLRANVEKSSIALRTELDQPQLNRTAIRAIATRLSEARGRLFDRELMMMIDMRAVLTDTQWNTMRAQLDRLNEGFQQRQQQRPLLPRNRRQ